jgi:hypothetical protein
VGGEAGSKPARLTAEALLPSVGQVIDARKEVTKLLQSSLIRRLVAVGFVVGALAAVAPATGLASNPGGGHGPAKTTR